MGKKAITKVLSCFVVFVILMSAMPVFIPEVGAILCPYYHMGTVISKDIHSNTITIQTEYEYGGTGLTPEWTLYSCTLKGVAPNEDALNEINVGDYVEAHSLGSPGGDWVTLAKLKSSAEKVITDIYGDPAGTYSYLYGEDWMHILPLLGNYKIDYKNTPDCSKCYGCNCEARYTIVSISKGSNQIASKLLYPSQNYVYEDEEYKVDITFNSGEAPAYPDCTDQPCFGPQAFSDFTIHIKKIEEKKPDLIIQDIYWSPSNPKKGDIITFTIKVKNQGDGDAGECEAWSSIVVGSDVSICDFTFTVPSLTAGEEFTYTNSCKATKCGEFYVAATVDFWDAVEESNDNNYIEKPISISCIEKPDLVIQKISWSPPNPKQGDTVKINVKTWNQGSGNAGGFYVCYYVDGSYYDRDYISSLSAGSTTTTSFSWTAECGTHSIKAVADCYNAIAERNENNNDMVWTMDEIVCKPDLIVRDIDWEPANPKKGDKILFNTDIKNQGKGDAGGFYVYHYIDGELVDKTYEPALDAGYPDTVGFYWTADKCGDIQVKAVIDATDSVEESNEGNNQREETVSVSCPNRPPTAHIVSIRPNPANQGETVSFSGYGTDPDGDLITAYNWISSIDGQLSTSPSFSTSSLSVGAHTIYFKVKDSHNAWSDEILMSLDISSEIKFNGTFIEQNVFMGFLSYYFEVDEAPEGSVPVGDKIRVYVYIDGRPHFDNYDQLGSGDRAEVYAEFEEWRGKEFDQWVDYKVWVADITGDEKYYVKKIEEKPDLLIQDISWSPSNPNKGDSITFTVKIKNQGSGSAGVSYVYYYIDGSYIASDSVPGLSAGSTSTQTSTWTADKCGNVQIKAVADATNVVIESNEGNNQSTETVNVVCPKKQVHNINTRKDFSSIQAAINDSDTSPGNTITVDAGTYVENVDVTKSVTIKSTSGNPTDTIVQALDPNDYVFNVAMNNVKISGFTVKGATGWEKAGIFLNGVTGCVISNNDISDSDCGISLVGSNNNCFESNSISNNEEGICLYGYDNPSNNNVFIDNNVLENKYRGVRLEHSSYNIFTKNTISGSGLGIWLYEWSNNNKIHLNNILNNEQNVDSSDSSNIWNSPELINYKYKGNPYTNYLGNYWDDYKEKYPDAKEIDSSGIRDTAYSMDSDQDNYPLKERSENYVKQIRIINFSNHNWIVKSGYCRGPGPNHWSDSEENVWVDDEGLHLKIINRSGTWYCAEISSTDSFGYGKYTFYLDGHPDLFDKNVVLGLFTYLDDFHEIDIEFSGAYSPNNSQYVIQPTQEHKGEYIEGDNWHRFQMTLSDGDYSTHYFDWRNNIVYFKSMHGHRDDTNNPTFIIAEENLDGGSIAEIPTPADETVHLNLYLDVDKDEHGDAPSNGQEVEIIIKDFNFSIPEHITIGKLIEKLNKDPESVVNKKFATNGWVYVSTHEAWKGVEILNDVLMTIETKAINPLPLPEPIKQFLKELLKYLSPANMWDYCFGIHSMGIMSISESDQRYNYFPLLHAYAKNDNLWPEPGSVVYIEGTWEKRTILWKTIGYIFRVDKIVTDKTYVTPEGLKDLDESTNVKMMALIAKKHIQPDNTYNAFYGKAFEIYLKLPEDINLQNLTFVEIQGELTSKTSTNVDGKKVLKCTVTVDNLRTILVSKAHLESQIKNKETIIIDCPVNATITDQYGRIIADNGTNQIPNASMLITNETKIFYLPADLTYSTEINAYDTGTFNFTRVSPIGNDISITKFENIPVTSNTKASVEIELGVTDYTMSIDYDGDGVTDEEKSPDVSETIEVTTPTNIIYVPDDYSTIQQAVNTANSGDTIIVRDGTYIENVDVNKPHLTIRSENGADCTIVQAANSNDNVFEVMVDYVNISGFTVKGASAGIFLNRTHYCTIYENAFEKNNFSILLNSSSNNILNNNIVLNGDIGICLAFSSTNTLINNNALNNSIGIIVGFSSNYNVLTNNNALNNEFGINLGSSSNNSISNNNCSNNHYGGICLSHSKNKNSISNNNCSNNHWVGIDLRNSNNNSISNNKCSNNKYYGIYLGASNNNSLSNNNCSNNQGGIGLRYSNNNLLYLNNFINNANKVYPTGSTNIWNSPSEITYTYNGNTYTSNLGNYWDGYTGSDVNGDGIGDTAYNINSDKDNYPLMERFENYFEPPSPLKGKIVFHSNRDNNFEMYVMDADGTNQTRLTRNVGNDQYAVWSSDSTKIAFTSEKDGNQEIYVMNPDGSNQVRLTVNNASDWVPDFSPDSKKIVFTSNCDGKNAIYIMNSDGSNQIRLTENDADDRDPDWSINNKIAFESNRDGNSEIYVMDADGTNVTRLTDSNAVDRHPAWSPDGSRIAFTSNRDGNDEIYVMNADGGNRVRITYNTASDLDPAWSPDGNYIAFASNRDGNYEIYVINVDGGNQRKLTVNTNEDNYHPDWGLTVSSLLVVANSRTDRGAFIKRRKR